MDSALKQQVMRETVDTLQDAAAIAGTVLQYGRYGSGADLLQQFFASAEHASVVASSYAVFGQRAGGTQERLGMLILEMASNRSGGAIYDGIHPTKPDTKLSVGLFFHQPFLSLGCLRIAVLPSYIGVIPNSDRQPILPSRISQQQSRVYVGDLEHQLRQAQVGLRREME
ncbi:MAG TPA: hypothetical protein VJK52_03445 [Candidatus Nanoarchaeia archaeon]|nr:hypothetical protein [Candidatus Nanoarchaeia archaeon]